MEIAFDTLSSGEIYHAMTQTIVPRPIAWVLSDNGNESFNLAPFSYFNAVCSAPPLIMFSVGKKPDGSDKDTLHNIQKRGKFVVHVPSASMADVVTQTAQTLPHGESELAHVNLPLTSFADFALPRLADCHIAMACTLYEVKEIGDVPQRLIFGKIESLYLSEDVAGADSKGRLKVNTASLDPLARLGASEYASLGEVFTHKRPE
ncbi:flavin reductase family protein [Corallincola platygyrae]|uniref:Flavin reductase family protein n=1 Tax=Corallincola platygyrae TaxID=1193278 RepID=A0ABW4XLI9_9GAMM